VPGYMEWYFKISHLTSSLSRRDTPWGQFRLMLLWIRRPRLRAPIIIKADWLAFKTCSMTWCLVMRLRTVGVSPKSQSILIAFAFVLW
jgi:hypothetical protein